jgi:hypothetical protein
MKIYIPSRGRAGVITQRQSTVSFVTRATFVVPPDEEERYGRVLRNASKDEVDVLACPEEGIAAVRRWIGEHAAKHKLDRFLMLDDDLLFCVRKSETAFNLRPADKLDVAYMLEWTDKMLDSYAHVSVSPRQANNVMPDGSVETAVKYNKRTIRYLAYQTEPFLKMKHGRVPVMEDFDVNLQLLRAGHQNIVSYWWAQDQRETGSAGGCSIYRNPENHDAAARKLAELHAPFVTLRKKVNKAGVSKHAQSMKERTEVTIYWEKAYKSSQERAA